VERAACAWLIRRFVDPETALMFVDDPVLWDVAWIVHHANLAKDRFDAPEASGLTCFVGVCR
jgi:hypothetical protein